MSDAYAKTEHPHPVAGRTRRAVNAWPEEFNDKLRALVADARDLSYKEIAFEMSTTFNRKFTRNAVLGRASRLGLRGQNTRIHSHQHRVLHAKDPVRARTKPGRVKPSLAKLPSPIAETGDADADAFLRADGSRGASNTSPMVRARTPEELAMRKAGHLPMLASPEKSKEFLSSTYDECKWPADDDCLRVCGAPAKVGSYCAQHARLAYRTPPTIKRNRIVRAGAHRLISHREPDSFAHAGKIEEPADLDLDLAHAAIKRVAESGL